MAETLPDLSIKRFGECKIRSPIHLSCYTNDLVADFVEDNECILYHRTSSSLNKLIHQNQPLPMFEAAGPRKYIYFDPSKVTAAIVTCGGLCPGINNVIWGIVNSLWNQYNIRQIKGIRYGFRGLVKHAHLEPIRLTPDVVKGSYSLGGTLLGSSRESQPIEEIVDFLIEHKINMLFTIGGDGTQQGALKICKEIEKRGESISVVGLPKTIDNDIEYISHTFGFDTACSIATNILRSAHAEAVASYNGITVVKLMGRQSGFLAATAAVASGVANFVLVPEVPLDLEPPHGFLAALERRLCQRNHAVVVVAEGVGQEIFKQASLQPDDSGNIQLDNIGEYLCRTIQFYFQEKKIDTTVRYIDPSYYVRSVSANSSDSMYCFQLAHNAVHAAMTGRTAMIMGYWNQAFTHIPMEAAISKKKVLNPESDLWLAVLETTGQPNRMINNGHCP